MPREDNLDQTRNIGVIAHIDAGKTTVTERILYYTGKTYKIGEVHEGAAVMDWMAQERERGITITAAATTAFWTPTDDPKGKYRLNIIDTPGHIDFTIEVQRSLRVLDGAVVVFDAVAGVEPQSETVWHQADKLDVPRICFINKIDRLGADFTQAVASIKSRLHAPAIAAQLPIGNEDNFRGVVDLLSRQAVFWSDPLGDKLDYGPIPDDLATAVETARHQLIEKIAETDDTLLEAYLGGEELELSQLRAALRRAVIAIKLFPVFVGSALKNKGIQTLLDAIVHYLPSPLDILPQTGINPKTGKNVSRVVSDDTPLAALAFKIAADPFVGVLTFIRVYSGILRSGSYVYNATKDERERVGRIVRLHANHREDVTAVYAGEIAAAIGLKSATTGDTLCDEANPVVLESIVAPEPVIFMAIEPKTKSDQEKMGLALQKLVQEDPTFRVSTNPETGQTIIGGMGELHLDIIVDRMKREYGVGTNVGQPQVAYKETIRRAARGEGKYIRQTGGRGQYGHAVIAVQPLARGDGVTFVNKVVGGAIPKEFIPAVEKGIRDALGRGIVAGFPMTDLEATLTDGSFHEVDSSEMAFQIAGSMAIQSAAKAADAVVLEPIMKVEVITPEDFMGTIMGDLNGKRGQIEQMAERVSGVKAIDAFVPLAEMFGYSTTLRSMSQGRASYTMEFNHYAEVPNHIAQKLVK